MHIFASSVSFSMLASLLFFAMMVWYKFWGEKDFFVETPLPLLVVMAFLVGLPVHPDGAGWPKSRCALTTRHRKTATYVVRDICRSGQVSEGPAAPPLANSQQVGRPD